MDACDEQFIEDLIGKSDGSSKKIMTPTRNPLLTSRQLDMPSFEYLFGLLSDNEKNDGVDPEHLMDCIMDLRSQIGLRLYSQMIHAHTWRRDQLSLLSLYPKHECDDSMNGWRQARSYRSLLNQTLSFIICG